MSTMRHGLRSRWAAVAGVALILAACTSGAELEAAEAAERYPSIAEDVAAVLSEQVTPLTSDDDPVHVDETSSSCRATGASYTSGDLLSGSAGGPEIEQITSASQEVLAEHGFSGLELENEDPLPMQTLLATDEQGGAIRVVVESRSGRPTLQLWWSAEIVTDGAACDDALLG